MWTVWVALFSILLAGEDAATTDTGRPAALGFETGQPLANPFCSEAMRADSRLADVCFATPLKGWAVGDRGAIWHSEDGGRQWRLQESGVACPLESVYFLDERTGWAVGGFTHPYLHTSAGVVLITRDGGEHWTRDAKFVLPALKRIRFFDHKNGWAIGSASAMYPSGVFSTDSGGRSWSPLFGAKSDGWSAADFLDPNTGAVAGHNGTAVMVRRGGIEPAQTPPFGLRGVHRLSLVPPVYGMLVGQGGLIMLTPDLGMTWQSPPGELPFGLDGQFDFRALEIRGTKCWIAGSPGTRIFHTPDAGRTWLAAATGQSLPIESIAFADDKHGWAVGELGTILATDDGGRTWTRQRSGGTRAALLGLFSRPGDVPLELFARLSGDEGYLGVVEVLNRQDLETPQRTERRAEDRVHEAVVGVGASTAEIAWRFPLRQPGLMLSFEQVVASWDRANDGRGRQELEAYLVRQIRLWRPEVIVTHDPSARSADPAGQLIAQSVLQAVQQAADPTAYAEQISQVGLEPWQAKKVYAALGPGSHGSADLPTAQLAMRLGRSLADAACIPRGLLESEFRSSPESIGFHLVHSTLGQESERDDFFRGIALQPGGEARRLLTQPQADTAQLAERLAEKKRNIRTILDRAEQNPQQGLGLLAQAGELTRGLDPDSSAQVLHHMANRYYRSGQWSMAAETYWALVGRHPDHPLTTRALAWLLQFYASSEAAWRVNGSQRITVQQVSAPAIDPEAQENRAERAAGLGQQLQRTRPDLYAGPAIGFPVAVVDRRRGFPQQSDRFYMMLSRSATRDAWWACAEGEQWLADPKGQPAKALLHCAASPLKPRLDGRLDDPVWQRSKRAELHSPQQDDADWPASVMLAYDDQFLYIAVECRFAPGAKYEAAGGPRPRDPDLSVRDRVDVFLDIDRDYVTYYRLTIDHRGWTGESCWGDASWDPTWFVAAAEDAGTWTAEAAIALDQLTGDYPHAASAWAVGIQRTVPGVGFQSWNTPAAVEVMPEGFGYLLFR
ncbi:MAG: hypothetical protein HUU20_07015 [Pirellulales bacterium]|nr:hypothetical protein [Pirellulales bacterium]